MLITNFALFFSPIERYPLLNLNYKMFQSHQLQHYFRGRLNCEKVPCDQNQYLIIF